MIKLTKKLLNENKIYNSHNLASHVNNNLYIDYMSADNGRLTSHYAYWSVQGIGFQTDSQGGHFLRGYMKTFHITCRENKEVELEKAKAWVKERYGLDITERDVWGNWHVTGTMDKLREIISKRSK